MPWVRPSASWAPPLGLDGFWASSGFLGPHQGLLTCRTQEHQGLLGLPCYTRSKSARAALGIAALNAAQLMGEERK